MNKHAVAILGALGIITLGAAIYAKERRAPPAAPRADAPHPAQSPVVEKLLPARASVTSNAKSTAQLEYSQKEYQFLRQHYKSPNPQAYGPLSGSRLKLFAKVSRNNLVYGRPLWPVVKEAIDGKTSALANWLDTGLSPDSTVILGYPYNSRVSLLDLAIQAGQRGSVKVLLSHGASVNPRGVGRSGIAPAARPFPFAGPLALAAQYGEDDVVRMLLKRGADVNQSLGMGGGATSALSAAVYGGGPATAYLLLTHGADIYSVLGPGGTLPALARQHYLTASMVATRNLLIEYGADPGAPLSH
ncbi:MAG: ankyrin repeat domain-containing protein [Steroidobacteraceae bacterium]|nr:ankyrin repeat domain-containing protein [Steroidobacteraceae bacterium]